MARGSFNAVRVRVRNFNGATSPPVVSRVEGQYITFIYCIDSRLFLDAPGSRLANGGVPDVNRRWRTVREHTVHSTPASHARAPEGLTVDIASETLQGGNVSFLQTSVNNGATWVNLPATRSISHLIPAYGNAPATILVRYRGTAMFLESAPVAVTLPARSAPALLASNVVFDGLTETIVLNDSGLLEYRRGTDGNWIPVPSGQASIPVTIGASSVTYQVRRQAASGDFTSNIVSVTVNVRAAAPNVTYRPATDNVGNFSTLMEFSLDDGDTWTRAAATVLSRSDIGDDAVTMHVRVAATATVAASNVRILEIPGLTPVPTGLGIDFIREVVTGVAPGMQSSTNGTTWTNITTDELNIATMIPAVNAANVTLRIRVAATATNPASNAAEVILTPRVPAPVAANVRFDSLTETVLLNDTMEHRIGTTGVWTPVPQDATSVPVTLGTAAATHQVRVRGTADRFPSLALSLTIPGRAAAPNANYRPATDDIGVVSAAMEFSVDGGTTWTRVTGTTITRAALGQNPVTVYVRTAATASVAMSATRVVEVPAGPANAPTGLVIDHVREVITGVAPGMQSSTNGIHWANITTNELNIDAMIPAVNAANVTLRIRVAATATAPASNIAEIILTPRVPTPLAANVRFDGFTESILLSDTMEYRVGTTGVWTPVPQGQTSAPVNLGTANVTHQVRVRGTADRFPSAVLSVTVPRRVVAPNASYHAATDAIVSVSTAMEFSLDGGTTWIRATGTTIPRAVLGHDAVTVYVRTAATATAPPSDILILNVPARVIAANMLLSVEDDYVEFPHLPEADADEEPSYLPEVDTDEEPSYLPEVDADDEPSSLPEVDAGEEPSYVPDAGADEESSYLPEIDANERPSHSPEVDAGEEPSY